MHYHFFDFSGIAYDVRSADGKPPYTMTCIETGEQPQIETFATLASVYNAMRDIIDIRSWEKITSSPVEEVTPDTY